MSLVEDRRALHRIPELDQTLPETMAYLRGQLAPLRCTLFSPIESSLCAWFDFGASRAIAFRSDADALPIAEMTGLPFASCHPGRMHACGHDGHMAILLELARRLDKLPSLDKNVLLVFQPAEETTGGARQICESGVFAQRGVEVIFGLHLWPDLPAGTVASRKNELMCRSCEITVEVAGRSAHIARAGEGLDALAAGVEIYRRATALEAGLPAGVRRLCRFGHMTSGDVRNAVSAHTRLEGSLRAYQDEVFYALRDGLEEICRAVSAETGCEARLLCSEGYPAVCNPPALFDRVRGCGAVFSELAEPVMTAEDFSWYQQYLPGMFFFLGVGPAPALHASTFDFDEAALAPGVELFWQITRGF